jgi:hypothetical protein
MKKWPFSQFRQNGFYHLAHHAACDPAYPVHFYRISMIASGMMSKMIRSLVMKL